MVRSVGDIKNEEDGIKATCDCELEYNFFVNLRIFLIYFLSKKTYYDKNLPLAKDAQISRLLFYN